MIFGAGNLKVYGAEKESVRGKVVSNDCCYMVIANLYNYYGNVAFIAE